MARLSPRSMNSRVIPSASATTFPARNAPLSSRASPAQSFISLPTRAKRSSVFLSKATFLHVDFLQEAFVTLSESALGFEAQLWAAADKMRGHMDASEYKHVCD